MSVRGQDKTLISARLWDIKGAIALQTGNSEDALQCYEKSYNIRTELSQPDDLSVASSLNNLGIVLLQQSKVDESICMHKKAKVIRIKDPEFGQYEQSCANLGLSYIVAGKLKEAETEIDTSLEIHSQKYGPESVEFAKYGILKLKGATVADSRTA